MHVPSDERHVSLQVLRLLNLSHDLDQRIPIDLTTRQHRRRSPSSPPFQAVPVMKIALEEGCSPCVGHQ